MTPRRVNAAVLIVAMLVSAAATIGAQPQAASWLDQPKPAAWNRAGAPIPTAPRIQGAVDPRCRGLARPPQLAEDRRVRDKGWDLVGAFQGGWQIVVIGATAGYDGMCRPLQFQYFVFQRGVFAGTLSPKAMDSRTDGALTQVFLQGTNRLTAEYVRYTDADPLCCPSRTTSVEFEIANRAPVIRPVSASTSSPR